MLDRVEELLNARAATPVELLETRPFDVPCAIAVRDSGRVSHIKSLPACSWCTVYGARPNEDSLYAVQYSHCYRSVPSLTKPSHTHTTPAFFRDSWPHSTQAQLANLHGQRVQSSAGSPARPVMWTTIDRWLETATRLDVSKAFPLDRVRNNSSCLFFYYGGP